ncbi:MAG: FISUMP domain-containing protein, partial [Bacteroidota bacterium]
LIPTDGLVAYYPFNGNANDESGNWNIGNNNGATLTLDRFGNQNAAYEFNGIDNYISLPSTINITDNISISFWIKSIVVDNATWPYGTFVIDRDICGENRDWSVGIGNGGKIQFNTGKIESHNVLTSSSDVNSDNWYYITIIRDAQNGLKKIYINGILNQSDLFDNEPFLNNYINIYIGACVCQPWTHSFFKGSLDDIRIYSHVLTEAEIQQLYLETNGGCQPTVVYGGQTYNTVKIGDQCWLRENLNVGTRININLDQTKNGIMEKYCYDNLESNCDIYGGLYQWEEMMEYDTIEGANGICPEGWRIPMEEDWSGIGNFLNGDSIAGGKLKEDGNSHWNIPNTGANNISGFTALPGGYRMGVGATWDLGNECVFWSSSSDINNNAKTRRLFYNNDDLYADASLRFTGYSVRCMKDIESSETASVITSPISNITQTTAISGGNITSDGGSPVAARGVCWSTSLNPTIADNFTSDGTGLGTFTSSITGLMPNTHYFLRAYATNGFGTGYGSELSFTTSGYESIACPGIPNITDIRNGKTYNTVKIGDQCWLKENLNIGTHIEETLEQSDNGIVEKYCYDNLESNCDVYGGLYQWREMMQYGTTEGMKGICPAGWHIPSDEEWSALTNFLGGESVAGGKMKEAGYAHWVSPNTGATNESGFTTLPAGYSGFGSFYGLNYASFFWSSSLNGTMSAWYRYQFSDVTNFYRNANPKDLSYSLRCLKDATTTSTTPTVTTSSVINIAQTSATSGGDVISDSGSPVTERGVCWNTSQNPTISDNFTTDGAGIGAFTSSITDLEPNTFYYVRAYATNSLGTGYGNEVSFTTLTLPQTRVEKIFFAKGSITDRDIFMINPDGSGLTPVIQWVGSDERIPRLSPDGTKLAFQSNKSGIYQIWIANSDGTNPYQLTNVSRGAYWDLCWHPNGQYIIFDDATSETDGRVCKIKIDGSAFEVLIDHTGSCEYDILGQVNPQNPDLMIYQHDHCWGPIADVYLYNLQTLTESLILSGTEVNAPHGCYRWSPDGSKIIFLLGKAGLYNSFDLYIMNGDGSNRHPITNVGSLDGFYTPCWSPDGLKVASNYFSDYCDDPRYLYTMNSDGSNKVQILYTPDELIYYPEWGLVSSIYPCPGTPTVDHGGQTYNTVQIGTQCWLKENLNIGNRIDGSQEQTNNGIIEKYCYNNLESNCDIYGGLYQWGEIMQYSILEGSKGICPDGWHIPTDIEWSALTNFLGGEAIAGGKMKEVGLSHWNSPNTGATDVSGFTGLPSGFRNIAGAFNYIREHSGLYSSTLYDDLYVWVRNLFENSANINRNHFDHRNNGLAVRCIKDLNSTMTATIITTAISNITQNTALSGGNVTSDGGAPVTARGVCWSASPNPTIADNFTTDGAGIGEFTSSITGLTPNTLYYVRAYATNSLGTGYGNEVSFITFTGFTCGSPITVNHLESGVVAPIDKTVTYGTVANIPGEPSKCWITSNLGADHQATAVDDATEESAGWYWQFNRKQGYKHDGTTRTPNTTWITSINEDFEWQSVNDPCFIEFGGGWRIATKTEWVNVDAIGNWTNWDGPWNSGLKM